VLSLTGQNASLPILLESLFTGAPSLSAQAKVLSKPFFDVVFVLSHDGRMETTFCILPALSPPMLSNVGWLVGGEWRVVFVDL